MFFGRNHAKAETLVLWPPHGNSWLIGKDSDAERDWRQEEKGTTVDEMARWHHQIDVREFEWTPGVVDGQGGLVCFNSWGRKELDMTERLNWTELNYNYLWKFPFPMQCNLFTGSRDFAWTLLGRPLLSLLYYYSIFVLVLG